MRYIAPRLAALALLAVPFYSAQAIVLTVNSDGTIDGGADTLDLYDGFDGDLGHGTGPADGGALTRSGFYQCSAPEGSGFSSLEDIFEDTSINPDGKLDLVEALRLINSCLVPDGVTSNVILLEKDATYTLGNVDNYWFGPNALPPVLGTVQIVGNGATIERSAGADPMRLFYVAPGSTLVMSDLTISGGLAQGGAGADGTSQGGGGGAALGGAIFNRGVLDLRRLTFRDNTAEGGQAGATDAGAFQANGAGGGLGGDASGVTGGGFYFQEFLGGEAGDETVGGVAPPLSGCNDPDPDNCDPGFGGNGSDGDAGGGGAFGGGGTEAAAPSGSGGLGGGFSSADEAGENGAGWLAGSAGAGGIGGGGGPGATGGFGGGSGGGQSESAFGAGAGSQGGSAFGGAVFNLFGVMKVQNTTFSGNQAVAGSGDVSGTAEGAAIYSFNSGFSNNGGHDFLHVTFHQNNCGTGCLGEAIYARVAYGDGIARHPIDLSIPESESDRRATVRYDMEIENSILGGSDDGGGIAVETPDPGGSVDSGRIKMNVFAVNNLINDTGSKLSIVGGTVNWDGSDLTACLGDEDDPDYLQVGLCGVAPAAWDTSAGLEPLADNGGLSFTHFPVSGGAAIDGAQDATSITLQTLALDQRGARRECDLVGGGTNDIPDIGSVEVLSDCVNLAPELERLPANLVLGEDEYRFGDIRIADEGLASDELTLAITSENIAAVNMADNFDETGAVVTLGNNGDPELTLQGRAQDLVQAIIGGSFQIADMGLDEASVTFVLTDTGGLSDSHTIEVRIDITPPQIAVDGLPDVVTSSDPFEFTVRISEDIRDFAKSAIQVVNGRVVEVVRQNDREYTVSMAAEGGLDGDTPVFFQFLSGAAVDTAGNESARSAEPYRIEVDIDESSESGGGGGGGGSLGPLALILLLAGALRFRRNGL